MCSLRTIGERSIFKKASNKNQVEAKVEVEVDSETCTTRHDVVVK